MDKIEFKQRNIKKIKILLIPFGLYMLAYFWFLKYSSYSNTIENWVESYTGPYLGLALIFSIPVFVPLFFLLSRIQTSTKVTFDEVKLIISTGRKTPITIPYSQINSLKLNNPLPNILTLLKADNTLLYTFRPMKNDIPNQQIAAELSNRIKFKIDNLEPVIYFKTSFEAKKYTRIT